MDYWTRKIIELRIANVIRVKQLVEEGADALVIRILDHNYDGTPAVYNRRNVDTWLGEPDPTRPVTQADRIAALFRCDGYIDRHQALLEAA